MEVIFLASAREPAKPSLNSMISAMSVKSGTIMETGRSRAFRLSGSSLRPVWVWERAGQLVSSSRKSHGGVPGAMSIGLDRRASIQGKQVGGGSLAHVIRVHTAPCMRTHQRIQGSWSQTRRRCGSGVCPGPGS